ncbi:MAG: hypothetical protein IJ111_07045 [Eggerthellaceae bacterium]|nr:hypothetical protein [Eggerthellaceae bacterium]
MPSEPYYILFAGVNGAGKSTLFRTALWQHGEIDASLARVNSDEILVANGWNPLSESDQIKAGRLAVREIRGHFDKLESFNQETTLTGKSIMRNIHKAHEAGFHIIVFYVCVDSPSIANARIEHRSSIGGHSVDPDIVVRRYDESLHNLIEIIDLCEEVYLYDNTVALELEARFAMGELAFISPTGQSHEWVTRIFDGLGYVEIAF